MDVLLVHDPDSEKSLLKRDMVPIDSSDVQRLIIIGPADDPAGIKGLTSTEVFKRSLKRKPSLSAGQMNLELT